jgi:hypothetical protein
MRDKTHSDNNRDLGQSLKSETYEEILTPEIMLMAYSGLEGIKSEYSDFSNFPNFSNWNNWPHSR